MIAHRNARGEVVELMQVKEGRCSLGPVGRMDGANLPCTAIFCTCTLPYLLNPVTVAFRGKSWIFDMVCGLIMVPRISSASLRGPGEFALLTWLAMIALVWKEIINSSARNVDNFHPLKGSRQPKGPLV
jgi:hypothetical protein